jgi:hypothetical protein
MLCDPLVRPRLARLQLLHLAAQALQPTEHLREHRARLRRHRRQLRRADAQLLLQARIVIAAGAH